MSRCYSGLLQIPAEHWKRRREVVYHPVLRRVQSLTKPYGFDGNARTRSSADCCFVTALVLLGAAFRVLGGFEYRSIWMDEAATVGSISGSLDQLVRYVLNDAVHPPLYFLSLFCITPLGESDFWLRFPSVICGILAIPLIYQLGRTSFNRATGIVAAALLAISPYHVWYSQEMRMYAVMVCLTISVGYFFLKTLKSHALKWWIGFVVTSGLAYATHYYALLLPLAQFVFLVCTLRQRPVHLRKWVVAQFIAFLSLAPWLYLLFRQEMVVFAIGTFPSPTLLSPLLTLQAFSMGLADKFSFLTVIGMGIILLLLVFGVTQGRSHSSDSTLFLALWLFVPFVVVLGVSLRRGFYNHRYFVVALPAYLTLVAAGATYLRHKTVRAVAILTVCAISLLSFSVYPQPSTFPQQDWKGIAEFIHERAEPSDIIAVDSELDVISLRHYRVADHRIVSRRQGLVHVSEMSVETIYRPDARLWIIESDVDSETRDWLRVNADQIAEERHFSGLLVILIDPEKS